MNAIDGITYGDSVKHGLVRDNSFIHPAIGFKFDVPQGFKIINQPAQVIATSQAGAVMVFDFAANKAGQDVMSFLRTTWLKNEPVSDAESLTINGMRAATASFEGSINNVPMTIRLIAIEFAPQSFARFQIGIPANAPGNLVEALKTSSYSFTKLSAGEKDNYKPYILNVVKAGSGDSVASLASRFPYDSLNEERFRMLNGMGAGDRVVAGSRYKVIRAQ